MELHDVLQAIQDTDPDRFVFCPGPGVTPHVLPAAAPEMFDQSGGFHECKAVRPDNPKLAVAWGFTHSPLVAAAFRRQFPDPDHYSVRFIDVMLNDQVVYRDRLIACDGFRALIPLPHDLSRTPYVVSSLHDHLARVAHAFYEHEGAHHWQPYEESLVMASIEIDTSGALT